MKFLKKFERFLTERAGGSQPQPSPDTAPSTEPATKPAEPGTKPGKRERPTPIPNKEPSENPGPKGKKEDLKKKNQALAKKLGLKTASAEEVTERFIQLSNKKGESVKKYAK